VICVSSPPQSWGVTLGPEIQVRTGFEPVINCDRRGASGRIQLVLMDKVTGTSQHYPVYWEVSTDLGSHWTETIFDHTPAETRIDPVAACDIWSNDTTRRMYFGWYTQVGSAAGDYFLRSLSGTNWDNGPTLIQDISDGFPDRPWLTANSASLYLSFNVHTSTSWGYVKHAGIPSGTDPVDWSCTSNSAICTPQLVFVPGSSTTLVGNFPVAAHADSAVPPNETAFLIARQYVTDQGSHGCTETMPSQNSVRISRSLDQGVTWQEAQPTDVDGADGFVTARDYRMVTEHISRDPNTSSNYAYAFYVRNETITSLPGKQNVLYCRASLTGGNNWNGEKMVFAPPSPPSTGFASEPPNCSGNTDGFFRIGRVWSSVDDNGTVYVAWMDNRYGKYSTTGKDYWHVFCSRSTNNGTTWDTPVRVSGPVSGTLDQIKAAASIGGYGNPAGSPDHIPPGDFLTCDAGSNTLYVAWPDSRANQSDTGAPTAVYFRSVQF
jgi:hypothetical protein